MLVTTGGGGDGGELITTYLEGLSALPRGTALRTTIVFGPQMPRHRSVEILDRFGALADVTFVEFEPDLTPRYAGADVVVAMAGYCTVCDLLSLGRKAVLVPRAHPVMEQLLRARLLASRGVFGLVEPDELTADRLIATVLSILRQPLCPSNGLALDGLSNVRARARNLLERLP